MFNSYHNRFAYLQLTEAGLVQNLTVVDKILLQQCIIILWLNKFKVD